MTPPRVVLFDFSGTLFDDTSAMPADLIVETAARRDRQLSWPAAVRLRAAVLRQAGTSAGIAARQDADLSQSRHRAAWLAVAGLAPDVDVDAALGEVLYDCLTAAAG